MAEEQQSTLGKTIVGIIAAVASAGLVSAASTWRDVATIEARYDSLVSAHTEFKQATVSGLADLARLQSSTEALRREFEAFRDGAGNRYTSDEAIFLEQRIFREFTRQESDIVKLEEALSLHLEQWDEYKIEWTAKWTDHVRWGKDWTVRKDSDDGARDRAIRGIRQLLDRDRGRDLLEED